MTKSEPVLTQVSPVLGTYVENFKIEESNYAVAASQIKSWLDRYLVVIVRNQTLSPHQQRDLVRHFGPLFLHHADEGVLYADDIPEVLEMRKEADGARLFGGSDWHADVTFRNPAAYVSVLHAKVLPPIGGDTAFASTIASYQNLSSGFQGFLQPLRAVHSYDGPDRPDHPQETAVHPVVRVHPATGDSGLYINRMFAKRFEGMSEAESKPVIDYLDRHMSRTEFTFRHRWQAGDLVFWDNRFTLHYPINDFTGHRRLLLRCTALEA
ncbi:MAG: TauD/TfdA family dioxygenase [Pseudomonadota bacterium]